MVCHFRKCHQDKLTELTNWANEIIEREYKKKKCVCGEIIPIPERFLNTLILSKMFDLKIKYPQLCSSKCRIHISTWNKGLTKNTDARIKKIAEGRIGINNPIFKVVNDPTAYAIWCQNIKESMVKWSNSRRGLTFEEWLGDEKASIAKAKMSAFQSVRKKEPHLGFRHTDATKENLARIAKRQLKERMELPPASKPQRVLYDALQLRFNNVEWEKEVDYYHVDITDGDLAIEVDGDFYHANAALGFHVKYEVQKRNLRNDQRKNTFLEKKGYRVMRIWEHEINNDIESVLDRIAKEVNV